MSTAPVCHPLSSARLTQLLLPTDHSDWPHDLASLVNVSYSPDDRFGDSGSGTAAERRQYHHCGAVAQPFPDVTMCLSTIWLLSRSGPDSGGT